MHPSRIFLALLTLFLVGIALALVFNITFNGWYGFIIFSSLILLLPTWKNRSLRYVLLSVVVVFLAFFRVNQTFPNNNATWLSFNNSRKVQARFLIIEEPKISGQSQIILAKEASGRIRGNVQIRTVQFPRYQFGDVINFYGELNGIQAEQERYRNYFKSKNIVSFSQFPKIDISRNRTISEWDSLYLSIRKPLLNIRFEYEKAINRMLPEPQAGLLSGILFGSKADLSSELLSLLSITGTIHIIALSGYNITIVSEAARILTSRFSRNAAFFVPALFIIFFILATALSASVVRAAIMGLLLLLASRLGRQSDALISVVVACAVMVFISPAILLYDAGFQLSFAAVCGILFLAPRIQKFFSIFGNSLSTILAATIGAQIFAWPITSYYFGNVSLISPLSNLLILPFIPILMLLGFLTATLVLIAPSLSVLSFIPWSILAYIIKVVSVLADFKIASVSYKITSPLIAIAYWVFIIDILLVLKRRDLGSKINT